MAHNKPIFDPGNFAAKAGAAVIDEPIINRPFDEPEYFWDTINWETKEQKPPEKKDRRRPAGYFYNPKGKQGTASLLEEQFIELHCVNEIRRRVAEWRHRGYPGITPVTRRLLDHWADPARQPRLFFCQREALETLIWLTEANPADRQGLITETVDGERVQLERAHDPYFRYCCKMATGTGKTVVMGMLIAWQVLNKRQYPTDTRFTDAILLMAPGITILNRLKVLIPNTEKNYYNEFDLAPQSLRPLLSSAQITILHRQQLAVKDDRKKKGVEKLGVESDGAFANRLLKRELGSKSRILVINDEGHHCYKPREKPVNGEDMFGTKEDEEERKRAAQWATGLEKIHRAREIQTCVDFSATPFYLPGSGLPVGRPFPWIVSDFGLLDAIESGLVKIPQMPIDDNHGDGKSPPAYFHLWRWINDKLPPEDRYKPRSRGKPEAVLHGAEPAIVTMIGNWKKTFDLWKEKGSSVPPSMIVVCQDTGISELVFKRVTRKDAEFDQFVSRPGKEVSFLFDSKDMKDIDKLEEGQKVDEREERLRDIMNSVGKEGQPGEQVRFVSSVSMLLEGWDASNVTQIVGLRAFTSQLLCEQVVGRSLRRRSYEVNPETGMLEPEYAEVYGVPFQVIPVKATKSGGGAPPPPSFLICAMKEREAEHLITFPRVEGYVVEVQDAVTCDWESVPSITVGKSEEPTVVHAAAVAGMRLGRPDALAISKIERHDRVPYYLVARLQPAIYRIAADLVNAFVGKGKENFEVRRARLFPQFLGIARRYVAEKIIFEAAPKEEIALLKWQNKIFNALLPHIHPADEKGRERIIPRIERYRPEGSTREVFFRTTRPRYATRKSHVSHVVLDSPLWEKVVAQQLELAEHVQSYVRNDHLDFTIPYVDEHTGEPKTHRPDFIVRLKNGLIVALEVKGHEREVDQCKKAAGLKWAKAVNQYYGARKWAYHVCYNPDTLAVELRSILKP